MVGGSILDMYSDVATRLWYHSSRKAQPLVTRWSDCTSRQEVLEAAAPFIIVRGIQSKPQSDRLVGRLPLPFKVGLLVTCFIMKGKIFKTRGKPGQCPRPDMRYP